MTTDPSQKQNAAEQEQDARSPKIRILCGYLSCMWQWLHRRIARVIGFLKEIDSLILAIATVCLVFIAYWQWDALEKTDRTPNITLVAANRAVLAPGIPQLEPIRASQPIRANVPIHNVGKYPAMGMASHGMTIALDMPKDIHYAPDLWSSSFKGRYES